MIRLPRWMRIQAFPCIGSSVMTAYFRTKSLSLNNSYRWTDPPILVQKYHIITIFLSMPDVI